MTERSGFHAMRPDTMQRGRKKQLNPQHRGGRFRKSRPRAALNYLFRSDRYLHKTEMKATELVVGRLRCDSPSIILAARVSTSRGGLASWRETESGGGPSGRARDGGQAVLCRRTASSAAVRDLILPLNICPVIGLIFRRTAADDDSDSVAR